MIPTLFDKLAEPFSPDAISWRVGSANQDKSKGLALAYLDARDVMDRLDTVCGPAGWQCRYSHVGSVTVCEIGIQAATCESANKDHGEACYEWLWKADGAGATDVEAEKGMLSDAFKRSAVRWGIGRYLYGLPSPWVDLVPRGKSYAIKDTEYTKLRQLLANYTGVPLKTSAQSKRDQDFEWFKQKLADAPDMETLGAIGREIKVALPGLPVAVREPLQDAYLLRREELTGERVDG